MPLYNPPVPTFTWANKPSTYAVGQPVFISNVGTKGSHWQYDGTVWKPLTGQALLASLDSQSSTVGTAETIRFQYQLPATFWQIGDILRVDFGGQKSGTTNTLAALIRIGTAGTVAGDQSMSVGGAVLPAGSVSGGFVYDFRLESATTATGIAAAFQGYGTSSSSAYSTRTIQNVSNSLWVSTTIVSNGTVDTVSLMGAKLWYISKAN